MYGFSPGAFKGKLTSSGVPMSKKDKATEDDIRRVIAALKTDERIRAAQERALMDDANEMKAGFGATFGAPAAVGQERAPNPYQPPPRPVNDAQAVGMMREANQMQSGLMASLQGPPAVSPQPQMGAPEDPRIARLRREADDMQGGLMASLQGPPAVGGY